MSSYVHYKNKNYLSASLERVYQLESVSLFLNSLAFNMCVRNTQRRGWGLVGGGGGREGFPMTVQAGLQEGYSHHRQVLLPTEK